MKMNGDCVVCKAYFAQISEHNNKYGFMVVFSNSQTMQNNLY